MDFGSVRSRRLVLSDDVGEGDLMRFADAVKAEKVRDVTSNPHVGLSREITWRIAPGSYLHFGQDRPFGNSYAMISGSSIEKVEPFFEILTEYFDSFDANDLLAAVDAAGSISDTRRSIVRAGMGAPKAMDEPFFARIIEAMRDGNSSIREAGLWAAAYALWPELLPYIEEMEISDEEELLRRQAHALANDMRNKGITP